MRQQPLPPVKPDDLSGSPPPSWHVRPRPPERPGRGTERLAQPPHTTSEMFREPPASSLALELQAAVGGAGATTLYELLKHFTQTSSGRMVVRREGDLELTSAGMPAPSATAWRLIVTTANDHGANAVLPIREGATSRVAVIARRDGIIGPREPRSARTKLSSLGTIVPVFILPFHMPWRYDVGAPVKKSDAIYKAVKTLVHRLDELDVSTTHRST